METNDWEQRYQDKDMPWEKGAPSPGLVDFLATHQNLPRGKVLVPGCGTGHDALAWGQAGFEVWGLDIAPSAIRLSRKRAKEANVEVRFQRGDFLHDDPLLPFDWIIEHTLYCAIKPHQRQAYARSVLASLKPGGQFLAVHYLIPDEDGPPFGTTREEVVDRFSAHFELLEDWVPRSYPNRVGLERMFWWRKPS